DTRTRYGLLLEGQAKTGRDYIAAFLTLEKVVQKDPRRSDVRRKLAHLALKMGRFSDTEAHVHALKQQFPKDGELQRLLALCAEGTAKFTLAKKHYEEAIKLSPKHIDSYVQLAHLLRQQLRKSLDDADGKADAVMVNLVKADPSAPAYLARARYWRERGPGKRRGGAPGHSTAPAVRPGATCAPHTGAATARTPRASCHSTQSSTMC